LARASRAPHDPAFTLCDSMPLPARLFPRAYRCKRFRGEVAFGKDTLLRQTFSRFRMHLLVCWPGLITHFSGAPTNTHEFSVEESSQLQGQVTSLVVEQEGNAVAQSPGRRSSARGLLPTPA
jgi:hypothetical protein